MFLYLLIFVYLIIFSIQDLMYRKVSNRFLLCFFVTVFTLSLKSMQLNIPNTIFAIIIFLLLFLISYITHGLGSGDVKIMAILAYGTGFFRTCITGIFACIFGILGLIVANKIYKAKIVKLPFVPCITAGYVTSFFLGDILR